MKAQRKHQQKLSPRAKSTSPTTLGLLELALLALPIVALTPNFFIIPDLSYQGNATQEMVVQWTAVIFLALSVLVLLRHSGRVTIDKNHLLFLGPLVLFLIWAQLSIIWTPEPAEGMRLISIWTCFAVFFLTALFQLRDKSVWWLLSSLGVLVLLLTCSQFIEYYKFKGEMFGVFFSHGITTEILALTLPLQLTVFLTTKKRWLAVMSCLLSGASATALLLTLRRGALLGTAVAVLIVLIALWRRWLRLADWWRPALAGAAIVVMLLGVVTFKREELIARIRGAVQLQAALATRAADIGLTSRIVKWITALEMAKRNPMAGVGNGGLTASYREYRRYFVENPSYARIVAASETEDYDEIRSPSAHSEFLQVLAELGIVGFGLWGVFWALVLRTLWRARNGPSSEVVIGAFAGLIAFGISSSISGFSFRFSPGTVIAALVAGLGCCVALGAGRTAQADPAAISIPRPAAVVALSILALFGSALGLRARDVLNSQQTQSQVDFRFSLDSPAINESLLRRYRQVLSTDASNSGAHLGMGLLLFQMKRPEEAIPHVEYALTHSWGRPYTAVLLAFAHEQTGDLEKAARVLADSLASFSKSVVARAVYIEILERQGKIDHAQKERAILEGQDVVLARSWRLALRMKDAQATTEAKRMLLTPPGDLAPMLAAGLVQARAYHYLQSGSAERE